MTAAEFVIYFAALAVVVTWLAWLARDTCEHPDVVDLGDGTGCCSLCDEIVELEAP